MRFLVLPCLGVLWALSGCGQKGPLTLPTSTAAPAAGAASPASAPSPAPVTR